MKKEQKIIVILGPTASGKSDLALFLARKYNGEIISADSRQVYRGMDIGTGKVTRDKKASHPALDAGSFFSQGIRHHLLDVASPKRSYNVTHFLRDARAALLDLQKRGKLAILCGGTGFWAQSLLTGSAFPEVKPNHELRKKLEKKTTKELYKQLQKKDKRRAKSIDAHNKIRLIRALEIVETLGKVPLTQPYSLSPIPSFIIVLNPPKEVLQENIRKRLEKRLKQGMIKEVERLRKDGVSCKRLESFGLEYKNIALFLQGEVSKNEMVENLKKGICHYAKRQLSFLRRFEKQGARILWIQNQKEGEKIAEKTLIS